MSVVEYADSSHAIRDADRATQHARDHVSRGGHICPVCGITLSDASPEACLHHVALGDEAWAANNRAMCDLFHRGVEPPRPPLAERDEVWAM